MDFKTTGDISSRNNYVINDEEQKNVDKINITQIFQFEISSKKMQLYFQKQAEIATLALMEKEDNVAHGRGYFIADWMNHAEENIQEKSSSDKKTDFLGVRDSLSGTCTRTVNSGDIYKLMARSERYSLETEMFYNAIKSNSEKSMFFNLFIIIESCEHSKKYAEMFPSDLFTPDEIDKLAEFIDSAGYDERKKSRIYNVIKNATIKSRQEKLFEYLQFLGLKCLEQCNITVDSIKKIISQRNNLFHSGNNKFDENLLYYSLFPIAREIVVKQYD